MSYEEQTRYIDAEIDAVCQRLIGEGMEEDLIFATLLTLAAYGFANMPGAPPMAQVFRETADELEAGEYTYPSDALQTRRTPRFTVIKGGGEVES
ncbi:hypothetical protein I7I49_15335 [Sinorhizobium meliloti]|nr:hypothetical protein [Sinorhizobium meliloti]